ALHPAHAARPAYLSAPRPLAAGARPGPRPLPRGRAAQRQYLSGACRANRGAAQRPDVCAVAMARPASRRGPRSPHRAAGAGTLTAHS
nr:hypothetical protein [Tanacetum cinerariifolium]